ncbi:hypothetical protein [Bradyrhizobium sp. cf659]|uniref:hypothetical protein n=1 Tax=Bradyrhizobium sp. cf659 TaxID=1761771 RepID=UPI0011603B75|nr:hypothetical protein [Bradyrhizobium sp. cf659]
MIAELAAQYAARASGAAISETSIKEITPVLNGRTQRSHRAILFRPPLLDPRKHDEIARFPRAKKNRAPVRNAVPVFMQAKRHDACAPCLSHEA